MKARHSIFTKLVIFTSVLLWFSCSNGLTKDEVIQKTETGKSYIKITANVNDSSRQATITPDPQVGDLSNFVLKGGLNGASETQLHSTAFATYTDLTANEFELDAGSWTFTLTAELDGQEFSGVSGTIAISGSTVTPIEFTLSPTQTNGGLNITIPFEGNADSVQVKLTDPSGTTVKFNQTYTATGTTYKILTDASSQKYVSLIWDITDTVNTLASGTYLITCDFYADGVTPPLMTMTSYVRVAGGITTTATVNKIYLNDVYEIEYHYMVNGTEVTGSPGNLPTGISLKNTTDTLTNKYSRLSGEITLPVMKMTDYVFAGWYDSTLNTLTDTIPANSHGTKTVYACLTNKIFVDTNGQGKGFASEEDSAANSITKAAETISGIDSAYGNSKIAWTIEVNGSSEALHNLSGSGLSSIANSITITGRTDNSTDVLSGEGENGTVLTIDTTVPVTIQNLEITSGQGTTASTINSAWPSDKKYGGGLLIKQGTVTLGDGALIQNNTADKGGGVCVVGSAVLKITGSAGIPAGTSNSNDVYFTTQSNVIKIAGAINPPLDCSNGVVAKYTLDSPAENLTMLSETGSEGWVGDYFANFGIVPNSDDASDAYFINPDGKTENGFLITKDNYSDVLNGITSASSTLKVKVLFAGGVGTDEWLLTYIKGKLNNMPCLVKLDFSYATGLVRVRDQAFNDCAKLYSVKLPVGVTYVGTRAFSGCTSLVSIDIPSCDDELEFGTWVFDGDTALASFVIPKNIKAFTLRLFYQCSNLKTITFEDGFSLDNLGTTSEFAFAECGVESIEIPASVKTIGQKAFESCTSLKTVTFATGSQIENIMAEAFKSCDIRSLVLPAHEQPISLGAWAFGYNANLETVTFNGNITFGTYVFQGCTKLESIDLSDVPEIADYAFYCASIKTITFASDTIIGKQAFYNCPISALDLTNVKEIGEKAFYQSSNNNVTATSLTIPKSLEKIGAGTFSGWNKLTSIDFKHKLWKLSGGTEPFDLSAETESQIIQYLLSGSYALSNVSKGWEKFQYGDKDAPTAVYDIVFKDGSATAYTDDLTLDSIHQGAAIAVIFYIGTDCSNDDSERMLGLGFKQSGIKEFAGTGSSSSDYSVIKCEPNNNTYPKTVSGSSNDRDGRDNFSVLKEIMTSCTSFPAFEYADTYGTSILSLPDTSPYATGWYLPTTAEFAQIAPYNDSERTHMLKLQAIITACGGSLVLDTSSAGVFMTSSTAKKSGGSTNCYAFFTRTGTTTYGTVSGVGFTHNSECAVAIRQFNE